MKKALIITLAVAGGVVTGIVVLVVLVGIMFAAGSDGTAPIEEATTTSDILTEGTIEDPGSNEAPAGLGIGSTVTDGTIEYTLTSVAVLPTDDFGDPAPAGTRLVSFGGTATASEPATISSLLLFGLRSPDGTELAQDVFTGSFDGDVLPGVPLTGNVVFEVPDEVAEASFLVSLDLFGAPAVYQVTIP